MLQKFICREEMISVTLIHLVLILLFLRMNIWREEKQLPPRYPKRSKNSIQDSPYLKKIACKKDKVTLARVSDIIEDLLPSPSIICTITLYLKFEYIIWIRKLFFIQTIAFNNHLARYNEM